MYAALLSVTIYLSATDVDQRAGKLNAKLGTQRHKLLDAKLG